MNTPKNMLNFLLDRSPSSSGQKTRQQTLDFMFSRMKNHNTSQDTSTPPSLTTASTATDRSSESAEDILPPSTSEHTLSSLNHTIKGLTSTMGIRQSKPQSSEEDQTMTLSNSSTLNDTTDTNVTDEMSESQEQISQQDTTETNVTDEDETSESQEQLTQQDTTETDITDEASESPEQLMPQDLERFDVSFKLDSLPGDGLDVPTEETKTPEASPAPATKVAQKVSRVARTTTRTILGKRGRDATESKHGQANTITSPGRSNLRQRTSEGLVKKEVRVSEEQTRKTVKISSTTTRRQPPAKPTKMWLTSGLYHGQDQGFDARLTESKNKAKRQSQSTDQTDTKTNRFLPPLMFAGERLLEQGRDFRLPWDVFSPLPPGQSRPDDWRKTQKNVFVGDAKDLWKKNKNNEYSICQCKSNNSDCGDNCWNRDMNFECDDKNCDVGADACTNRPFAELKARLSESKSTAGSKYNAGVEVMKTVDRGYGLRSNRTFNPGQIIVEYTGEIITRDESNARMRNEYKDKEVFYLMDFDQGMILDGTRGSIARFVNHSCDPNCRIEKLTVEGKPRMALFAGENGIMTGEELTYDYSFKPNGIAQPCYCGSSNCRGVLGPKSSAPKAKEAKDAVEQMTEPKGIKRKAKEVLEDAVEGAKEFANKRRKINLPKTAKKLLAKGKKDESPAPKFRSKAEKQEAEAKANKPLPRGWVYPSEARPHLNILDEDPEAKMRAARREAAAALKVEGSKTPNSKKRKLDPVKEDEDEEEQSPRKKSSKVTKAADAGKNVLNTIKKGAKAVTGSSSAGDADDEKEA